MLRRSSVSSRVAGVDAVDQDPAGRRLDQPVDHLQRRRLAAAGGADEDADLARRDLQREVVDRAGRGLARVLAGRRVIALRDVVELDDRGFATCLGHRPRRLLRRLGSGDGRRSADSTASADRRRYWPTHAHHRDPARAPRAFRSTRRSRQRGTPCRGRRSRSRSSGSRRTRAWSVSDPATRWTGSRRTSTCSSARTRSRSPATSGRSRRSTSTPAATGRSRSALWDIAGQVAGLPVATLFGGALDGIPAYASCGMLLPPAERAETRAPAARGGLPGDEDPDRPAPAGRGPGRGDGDPRGRRRHDGR